MTQILTKTSVATSAATRITATANDDKYDYNVDYQVAEGNTITSLVVSVKSGNDYIGTLSLNGVNKNLSVPETADVVMINTTFDAIIAEIKTTLSV